MAFDQTTRNRLQRFVSEVREKLTAEFTRQLQNVYGLDPISGEITPLENLKHLDDVRRETARLLRETLDHYRKTDTSLTVKVALDRIVREQAFTVLNRLAALRMAEARGLLIESLANGYDSKGFQLYARLAGTGLGEKGDAYRCHLLSIFDEFALDLRVLFDRFSPLGRLFPGEASLLEVLSLVNDPEIAPLWAEDETLGWIYQYFNSKEERKKMRDESAAPRNSRELAVRNQFFTPRYVVEFLTDNTLGRIWYEMTRGETQLKEQCRYLVRRPNEIFLKPGEVAPPESEKVDENLSQEDLLKLPVYIPHRPLKDPREIRVLDPACGSMHFGLYAFDLLEVIYEEAWEFEALLGAHSFQREPDDAPLRESYEDKAALLCDMPRLIVEHNLHGIDIDPRAVQIAGLSLWLRAQRTWKQQGVRPTARPQVRRSGIVCAEPMPGEDVLLNEFIERQLSAAPELRLVAQLARRVFKAMKLAGEAGSLLKIEGEVAGAVAEAKAQWLAEVKQEPGQGSLFADLPKHEQQRLDFEMAEITDETFWGRAEGSIYTALREYADQAENGGGYQRRLFAEDAARGFAFIDICRNLYDVVLMNPPFGKSTKLPEYYLTTKFPEGWKDLYAAFMEIGQERLNKFGFLGCITSSLFLYSKQLRFLRDLWIEQSSLSCLVELGEGVLDGAAVETALTVTSRNRHKSALFFDATNVEDKKASLLSATGYKGRGFIPKNIIDFVSVFGSPFCYHMPAFELSLWKRPGRLDPSLAVVAAGNLSFNDERFLRLRYEVPPSSIGSRWMPFEKGGEYQPFYSPSKLVYNWDDNGKEARAYQIGSYGTDAQTIQSISYWFREGITYPRISSVGFGPRLMGGGSIFATESISLFCHNKDNVLPLIGLLASTWTQDLLNAFGRYRKIENRAVSNLPYDQIIIDQNVEGLTEYAQNGIQLVLRLEAMDEISSIFQIPECVVLRGEIGQRTYLNQLVESLQSLYRNLDITTAGLLFKDEELDNVPLSKSRESLVLHFVYRDLERNKYATVSELMSYLIGLLVGRWDLRFATGETPEPKLPDPFAPLPVCPPGMLQNATGLPAKPGDVPASYPLRISWPGILADDKGHTEDIERCIRDALQVIWPDRADAIEQEACEILGVRSLRDYFRKPAGFFADHLKRYSKSRRQAPIYWPLSTQSGEYTLWLYYHRLNDQTLYTCVNNFVEPKLREVGEELNQLRVKDTGRSRDEEKRLESLQDFEMELQAFRDALLRLAKLPWRPNLNDGVQITAAPLWKLFRLPKWQKTLKETWQALEKGDYDWAHLAMTIWPQRVVPKCTKDRSLAIAHDVEDIFWVEDEGRWRVFQSPKQEIEEQKRQQRSDARGRVKQMIVDLARSSDGPLSATDVGARLAAGKYDDRELALLVYPERMAERCWEDVILAQRLGLKHPPKRTKAARLKFRKEIVAKGCAELAPMIEAALDGRAKSFAEVWREIERGDQDQLSLALALWPERVVDRCAEDATLAEQHGLRKFFWVQHPTEVWRRREAVEVEITTEVARRRGASAGQGA